MTDTWTFRKGVSTENVLNFLRCVTDITDALNELSRAEEDYAVFQTVTATQRISVQLRKLLLDGNGHLIKSCFSDPNLHPLKRQSPHDGAVTFVQKFERNSMVLGFADGRQSTIEVPEYEQRTTIHPLYGIRHDKDQEFAIEMPFDRGALPIKFKAWMNTKVLQIDTLTFTAEELLREIVNKEGVHLEDGKKLAMPDGSSFTLESMGNKRYKAVSAVKFGGMSYAQYFTLCTGLYMASRSKTLINNLPIDNKGRIVARICRKIEEDPNTIYGKGQLENQTYHGIVLDSNRNLRRDSIGSYSTLLKIP